MAIVTIPRRSTILAMLLLTSTSTSAFFAPSPIRSLSTRSSFVPSVPSSSRIPQRINKRTSPTALQMSDTFSSDKYTEAAWAILTSLSRCSDYYEASTIEAPLMLEVLLNPSKHAPGDEKAESAKRVAEKILQKSGVDVASLRAELEKYLAKQPKMSNAANKMQGQSLVKVLDRARTNQSLLGVSDYWLSYFLKNS